MKRARLNVLLLVGVVALAAFGWFTREQPEPERPLTSLTMEEIDRIRIEHPERPAIALQRVADGWMLTEPVQAVADAFEVNALLNLAALPMRRQLQGGFDPAELGLDPPEFVITLNDLSLQFGDTDPISAQRFMQAGEMAALVDNPPSAALDDDYSDLVSKQLLPDAAVITAIELPDGSRIEPGDSGWSARDQPLVDGWKGVRAMWNAAAPEAEPEEPYEQVVLTLETGEPVTYLVLRRNPQFEIVNPDLQVQYTLSAALVDTLLERPAGEAPLIAPEADPAD